MEIDTLDSKILNNLQINTDISLEDLGEKIGLSRNACWRRIKQLETAGVIKRRVAILDANKLGLGLTVFISVRTNQHSEEWLASFAKIIKGTPEVLGAYRMTGDLDYLIRAQVADMEGYDLLYKRLIAKLPFTDVSASFVMEGIKDTTALPLDI